MLKPPFVLILAMALMPTVLPSAVAAQTPGFSVRATGVTAAFAADQFGHAPNAHGFDSGTLNGVSSVALAVPSAHSAGTIPSGTVVCNQTGDASVSGLAALGTLTASAAAITTSGPLLVCPQLGAAPTDTNGSVAWSDLITLGGLPAGTPVTFTARLTLHHTFSIQNPASSLACMPFTEARTSASYSGGVSLSLADDSCTPNSTTVATGNFTMPSGSVIAANAQLTVGAHADGGGSAQVDASHTSVFQLDPVTPGASYSTASGTSYMSQPVILPPCGNCGGPGPVDPGATPELDSLLLFGSGISGLAGYALLRLRGSRRS